MDKQYSSADLAGLFGVSTETVGNRANHLARYLSPSANPGRNKQRWFTEYDLQVMRYANDRLKDNASFDDIRNELAQNPELPPVVISDEDIQYALVGDREKRLALQVSVLSSEITRLEDENKKLKVRAEKVEELEKKIVRLETQLESLQERGNINDLIEEIGRLKGIIEYLEKNR